MSTEAAPGRAFELQLGGARDAVLFEILGSLELIVLVLDESGRITYCNEFFLGLAGWSRRECLGRDALELLTPPTGLCAARALHQRQFAEHTELWANESDIVIRSGARRRIRWKNGLVRADCGRVTGTMSIGEDITERAHERAAIVACESRYQRLFNASPLPMWVHDADTLAFLAVNDAAVRHYGYSREEFLAMQLADICAHQDDPALEPCDVPYHEPARGSSIGCPGVRRHRRRDGTLIDVEISSHAIDFGGRPARVVSAHDVSERVEEQRRIARLDRVRDVIGGMSSAMVRFRVRGALLQEACRIAAQGTFMLAWVGEIDPATGRMRIVASHGEASDIESILAIADRTLPREIRPSFRAATTGRPAIIPDTEIDEIAIPMRGEHLRRGYRSVAAFPLFVENEVSAVMVLVADEPGFFDDDEVALISWMTRDLSFALETIEKSSRLEFYRLFDPTTGLANATLFRDRLDRLVRAAAQGGDRVCVMVIDLVQFSRLNESMGREAGNQLLREIAGRLDAALSEQYTLARISADSFALASSRASAQIGTTLHARVLELFDAPFKVRGRPVKTAVRAGIALFPDDGASGDALLNNAEAALKTAKSSGERCAYFSRELDARIRARAALEEELRDALAQGQFVLHYQPRISMASGALVGAESLIRWRHPARGLLPPGDFIALAEAAELIIPIGAWVIDQVCAQQATWAAAGLGIVPVAINVSPIQLARGDVLETLGSALKRHAVSPGHIELELTESAVMDDPGKTALVLASLRKLGVRLALDDFGTGYSSLAHLKRFPFDMVKIDRSFVTDVTQSPDGAAIATAIIAMAHVLGLNVVAEGVEAEGQFTYLRAQCCDEMQGNFFSPAIDASAFEQVLRSGRKLQLPLSANAGRRSVLVVDNEQGVRAALTRALRNEGCRVLSACSGAEGLEILAVEDVQVIICDQRMPGMTGTEFMSAVRQMYPLTVRIILTGYTDLEALTQAVNRGAVFRFLTKPWDDNALRETVRDAFDLHAAQSDPDSRRRAG